MSAAPLWLPFWGKTYREDSSDYHLLVCHCLDVAAVAHVMLETNTYLLDWLAPRLHSRPESLRKFIVMMLALHDIGKFDESFQNLAPDLFFRLRGSRSGKGYPTRHDALGYIAWADIIFPELHTSPELCPAALHDMRKSDKREFFDALVPGIFGHHGSPISSSDRSTSAKFSRDDEAALLSFWRDASELLYPDMGEDLELFMFDSEDACEELIARIKACSWSLAGLYVLCDWTGSDRAFFTFHESITSLDDYWHHCAVPAARRALAAKRLLDPPSLSPLSFDAFFPDSPDASPRPLQRAALELCIDDPRAPHLFIIEDETGSGKTEAALVLASKLDARGVYIGLPTMATSNAMYARLARIYARLFPEDTELPSLVLAHGQRALMGSYQDALLRYASAMQTQRASASYGASSSASHDTPGEAVCNDFFAQSRHLALFAEVGVGTIDQALISILPIKHQSLRLFALSQKVLIVDEVHAYDSYTNELLCHLIAHHAAHGGSTIMLSATLPECTRQAFVEAYERGVSASCAEPLEPARGQRPRDDSGQACYPMLSMHSPRIYRHEGIVSDAPSRHTRVEFLHHEEDVLDWVARCARQGACVCWIRNTVGDAITAVRALVEEGVAQENLILFHARMTMYDRLEVEQQILDLFGKDGASQERAGKIVVATQVIEQSLDVDFDEMISDLTTLDLLIQRLGRYRRHARDARGRLLDSQKRLGADERGERTFHVFSPRWSQDPEEDWYVRLFPHGAYVYPEHDKLWRTMRALLEDPDTEEAMPQGRVIALPRESRALVEYVFDPDGHVPDNLEDRFFDVLVEQDVEHALAVRHALVLEHGYGVEYDVFQLWGAETRTPTRLGEPSTTLRLVRSTQQGLEPWAPRSSSHPWRQSEVRFATKYAAEACIPPRHRKALSALEQHNMDDHARYSVCVVLEEDVSGCWRGQVLDADGQAQTLTYSAEFGLERE